MSVRSYDRNTFKQGMKPFGSSPHRPPGFLKKRETDVFVRNLPLDITEEEITVMFKDFKLTSIRKRQNAAKCFAFLSMDSPEAVQRAMQVMNGRMVKGRRITVEKPSLEPKQMPDLEPVHNGLSVGNSDLLPKIGMQTLSPLKKNLFAIPVEMRSSFLAMMLRDCFKGLDGLMPIPRISVEAGLLVTDTVPQTPFFWAIQLTEENHQNMQKLFSTLAEVESQQPFLAKHEVWRGTRCMAECVMGEEGGAWNRCWVWDKVENLAVVFFVDFGRSATVPVNSLRRLDKDEFWAIKPLAQPFMLSEDVFPPQLMVRQILEGVMVPQSQVEAHIMKFISKTKIGERSSKNS